MFFKAMPYIVYKTKDTTIATKDIFNRVGLDRQINTTLALESYYIGEGETPDIVANNIYGSSNYHWVLLIVNDIVNSADEWPRRTDELFDYTESKYGVGNTLLDHHYRLVADTSIIVDYDPVKILSGEIQSVSNYDYELELNQSKRQIFILRPAYLAKFVENYKRLMAK